MVDDSRQNVWLGHWRSSAETHTLRQEGARVVGEVAHAHHLPSYALGYDNNFKRCHYIQLIVKRFFNCLNHNFNYGLQVHLFKQQLKCYLLFGFQIFN